MVNGKGIIKIEAHNIAGLFPVLWAVCLHLHTCCPAFVAVFYLLRSPDVSALVSLFVQTRGRLFSFSTLAISISAAST